MRKDYPLAKLNSIKPENLIDIPLMCSDQMKNGNGLVGWAGKNIDKFNFVIYYNLITTPAMLAEEGIGCVFTFNNLVNTEGTNLCFKPLNPNLETSLYFVWRQDKHFSKAAQIFLDKFQMFFQK